MPELLLDRLLEVMSGHSYAGAPGEVRRNWMTGDSGWLRYPDFWRLEDGGGEGLLNGLLATTGVPTRIVNDSLSLLEGLGFIDMDWETNRVHVLDPSLASLLEEGSWLVLGARGRDITDRLEEMGANVEQLENDPVRSIIQNVGIILPTRMVARDINDVDGFIRVGDDQNPASWLALHRIGRAEEWYGLLDAPVQAEVELYDPQGGEWFNRTDMRFTDVVPNLIEGNHHVRRWTDTEQVNSMRRYQLVNIRDGMVRITELKRSNWEWALYFTLDEQTPAIRYNPDNMELKHYASMPLPLSVRRVLSLCSGSPPANEIVDHRLWKIYQAVPACIALGVADRLSVAIELVQGQE